MNGDWRGIGELLVIVKDIDKYDFNREYGLIDLSESIMECIEAEKEKE